MYIEERRVIAVLFFGRNLRSHLSDEYTIIVKTLSNNFNVFVLSIDEEFERNTCIVLIFSRYTLIRSVQQ